jgi:hypothetical protein
VVLVDVVLVVAVVLPVVEPSVLVVTCNTLELAPLTNQAATRPQPRRSPPAKTAAAGRLIAILLSGRGTIGTEGTTTFFLPSGPGETEANKNLTHERSQYR